MPLWGRWFGCAATADSQTEENAPTDGRIERTFVLKRGFSQVEAGIHFKNIGVPPRGTPISFHFMYILFPPQAEKSGICRAVKVRGWIDALPPAFTRGVSKVAHTGDGGSTKFRQQSVKQIFIFLCFPSLFFVYFYERYVGDWLPPMPVCALVSPPSQVRGARPCSASVPHTTA